MNFTTDYSIGDIIAMIAIIISFLVLYRTRKFSELQAKVLEVQSKLGELQIKRELRDSNAEDKCELGINFVKIGNTHRMRVFNRGPAKAHNVTVTILDGHDLVPQNMVDQKFPVERIDKHQSIDVLAHSSFGSGSKVIAKITWKDKRGNDFEDDFYASL